MIVLPWSSKKELKAMCDSSPLGRAVLRYLEEPGSDPIRVIDHLLYLVAFDTTSNIKNRELLEGLKNTFYEKPKRKKRRKNKPREASG